MYDSQTFEKLLGSTPPSESPLVPPEVYTKTVVMHYWTEYDTGRHIMLEIEAGPDHTVQDMMNKMIREVKSQLGLHKDSASCVIRTSNKVGQPKTDIPIFETSQKIHNLGFVRFVLCDSDLDFKARSHLEEVTYLHESLPTTSETEIKTTNVWKKFFCCLSD